MKKMFLFFAFALALTCNLISCDKWDQNGDLAGMWQMTEWWQEKNGQWELVACKDSQIYYCFQLSMVRFQRTKHTPARMIQGSFQHNGNILTIYNPLKPAVDKHEDFRDMKELADFGVHEDGIFRVAELSSARMVLVTKDCADSLCFRKY